MGQIKLTVVIILSIIHVKVSIHLGDHLRGVYDPYLFLSENEEMTEKCK